MNNKTCWNCKYSKLGFSGRIICNGEGSGRLIVDADKWYEPCDKHKFNDEESSNE